MDLVYLNLSITGTFDNVAVIRRVEKIYENRFIKSPTFVDICWLQDEIDKQLECVLKIRKQQYFAFFCI